MYRNAPIGGIRGAKVRQFIEMAIIRPSKKPQKAPENTTFKII